MIAERYRLIRELGEGGMGVVWVARSLVLGVEVAVKLIRAGRADPELASRMAREAQVTATLGHPAIVRVFDFGTTARGEPFLAMELAHGETLAALIRREGKLRPEDALKLVLPIVDGLRCAHEHGIVHRDIKPENVFIARDALGRLQPKLLDFGIALLEAPSSVSRLTQLGDVLGSPEFMSPEQARGMGKVDLRTDVWALCVVLYDLLTGAVPFPVQNYNALMQAILHQRPTPTHERGAGDRDLWQIIAKGLEKSRDKRWASMGELGAALAQWLLDRGVKEDLAGNSLQAVWLKDKPRNLAAVGRRLRARVPHAPGRRWLVAALAVAGVVLASLALRRAPARAAAETPPIAGPGAMTKLDSATLPTPVATQEEPAPAAASPEPEVADARRAPGTAAKVRGKTPVRASAPPSKSRRAPATKKSIRDFGI